MVVLGNVMNLQDVNFSSMTPMMVSAYRNLPNQKTAALATSWKAVTTRCTGTRLLLLKSSPSPAPTSGMTASAALKTDVTWKTVNAQENVTRKKVVSNLKTTITTLSVHAPPPALSTRPAKLACQTTAS
jgi:hypothetical protein